MEFEWKSAERFLDSQRRRSLLRLLFARPIRSVGKRRRANQGTRKSPFSSHHLKRTVQIWNLTSGEEHGVCSGQDGWVVGVHFSKDDNTLVSISKNSIMVRIACSRWRLRVLLLSLPRIVSFSGFRILANVYKCIA